MTEMESKILIALDTVHEENCAIMKLLLESYGIEDTVTPQWNYEFVKYTLGEEYAAI